MRLDPRRGAVRRRWSRGVAAVAALALGAAGLVALSQPASAAIACEVDYSVQNEWGSGFTANVTISNLEDAVDGWTLEWDFPGDQQVTNGWSGNFSQSGSTVTVESMSWNGSLASGGSVSFGFNGSYSGNNEAPSEFTLNGTVCDGGGGEPPSGGDPAIEASPSSVTVDEGGSASFDVSLTEAPSSSVTVSTSQASGDADLSVASGGSLTFDSSNFDTPQTVTIAAAEDDDQTDGSASFTVSGGSLDSVTVDATESDNDGGGEPPPGERVDNPYAGADVYVNPDWSQAAQDGGAPAEVYNQPTGVWLDRIAAIESGSAGENTTGLEEHLDQAVQQDEANGSTPLVFQVVIYNLPGRDCAALASNGELGPEEIDRYKNEYVDVIANIIDNPEYSDLRIVPIVEIDSLPNLVTNTGDSAGATELCNTMQENGNYVEGVGYSLATLGDIPNVYNYVDAAHHGWIGWSDNFGPSADIMFEAANAAGATPEDVHGFITNTANYSALEEPYIDINGTVGGQQIRQSNWIDWNDYNAELPFAQDFRDELVSAGFNSGIGMLIDTSRNGWGGPERPDGASDSTDLNTFVNESRIDRRIHKGNWCNQAGAGIGERPTANPESGIDAYVWIKPPGESDGSSEFIENDEGKGFDEMCDPDYGGNERNGNNPSGALPNAPISGHWFQAQFDELLANAHPPVE